MLARGAPHVELGSAARDLGALRRRSAVIIVEAEQLHGFAHAPWIERRRRFAQRQIVRGRHAAESGLLHRGAVTLERPRDELFLKLRPIEVARDVALALRVETARRL